MANERANRKLNGYLDEFRMYNEALGAADIVEIYNYIPEGKPDFDQSIKKPGLPMLNCFSNPVERNISFLNSPGIEIIEIYESFMKYLFVLFFTAGLLSCQSENEDDLNGEDPGLMSPDLIAYFPLDSSYTDESGNDHLLLAYGVPEFKEGYDNGPGSAVLLDGYDDYLVGTIGKLDTFSISMWLRSYRYFVGEWPHWRSTLFDYSNKQVYGYIDAVSGATQISCGIESELLTRIVPDNIYDWFHLYIAVSNDVKIYFNGGLSKTEPLQDTVSYLSDLIYLGRAYEDDEIELTYFYGLMDEIRIFNGILDQAEIDELSINQ